MSSTQKREDRRIQRTRRVLQQAFKEAVQEQRAAGQGVWGVEKSFAALSVQEIAARANVNRGTF